MAARIKSSKKGKRTSRVVYVKGYSVKAYHVKAHTRRKAGRKRRG